MLEKLIGSIWECACAQLFQQSKILNCLCCYERVSMLVHVCVTHTCRSWISSWSDTIWPAGAEGGKNGGNAAITGRWSRTINAVFKSVESSNKHSGKLENRATHTPHYRRKSSRGGDGGTRGEFHHDTSTFQVCARTGSGVCFRDRSFKCCLSELHLQCIL